MAVKKIKEVNDEGKFSNITGKFFFAITIISLIFFGFTFAYTTIFLFITNISLTNNLEIILFALFILDAFLFFRRKKNFIPVSILLLLGTLIVIFIRKYIGGEIGGTYFFDFNFYFIFLFLFIIISIITLLFSKTIKKYLRIIKQ